MTALTLVLICGSVWFCFQLLAVLIGWRFTKLRATAVVEWQGEWDYDEVEAIARLVAAVEEQPDDFALWANELRERAS